MSPILVTLIEYFGEIVVKYAFKYLETRNPGIKPVLEGVCAHVSTADDKAKAVCNLTAHLEEGGFIPTLK